MPIEPTAKLAESPAVGDVADPKERAAKFIKGEVGVTPDRWTAKPDISDCWRGDYRDWHIEDGRHYQEQLYCRFWECFINPSGFSCEICAHRNIVNWQTSQIDRALTDFIEIYGPEAGAREISAAVEHGQLSQEDALEIAERLNLSDVEVGEAGRTQP